MPPPCATEAERLTPAVLYAAKSTEDRHGSIQRQLDDCRAMAASNGWTEVDWFSGERFSAYKGDRPWAGGR